MRVLLDARLDEWGARLDADKYADVLTYLLETCWELSGLDAAGEPRRGWRVRCALDPEELEAGDGEDLGWYVDEHEAWAIADARAAGEPGAIVAVEEAPPPGAYDPELGLAFSTYSRRILKLRVVDWYRRTFGDSRYEGGRRTEVSLEALANSWDDAGEEADRGLDAILPATPAIDDDAGDLLTTVALGWS